MPDRPPAVVLAEVLRKIADARHLDDPALDALGQAADALDEVWHARKAGEQIRDHLREQEVETLDAFGTRLGPPCPRPPRDALLTVLRALEVADEPDHETTAPACRHELALWGATTTCVLAPHGTKTRHRNRYGTEWGPVHA